MCLRHPASVCEVRQKGHVNYSLVKLGGKVGPPGLIAGSGRSPGEGNGTPLQYSCLENSVGYNPWGCKESDTTERLHFH